MSRPRKQADTYACSVNSIMATRAFARGVAEVRAGRPPDFDRNNWDWEYERGRQWATVAPKDMPLKIGRSLNLAAIQIFLESEIP
jgi:hypothetical protein